MIEAPEDKPLADLLYPKVHQILRKLSLTEGSKAAAHSAMRALRSFAAIFKVEVGDFTVSVDPEPGVADSGNLEFDLSELFIKIGDAARQAQKGWTLLIDEVQYLKAHEFAALIVAIHKTNQKSLPILFFGAGLPQTAALSGDAKSYAERLFHYPAVGPLDLASAFEAIQNPILEEGEVIDDDALWAIYSATQGYPYFLQEWGYQIWNTAPQSPITVETVIQSADTAIQRLDEGFFKVRFERLTPRERDYVFSMAVLGHGPYRSSEVAAVMGQKVPTLGPLRANIIRKGMIYSPSHGDIDFTVPLFADYLKRLKPEV